MYGIKLVGRILKEIGSYNNRFSGEENKSLSIATFDRKQYGKKNKNMLFST